MPVRRNFLRTLCSFAIPALATAVIGAAAGLHAPTGADIPTRTEQIQLAATIDTAADAVGVSDSSLYFMSQSDLNTAMQQMQTMGITQIRVLLPWRAMEPTDGTYSWTQSDQLLSTAKQYGIAVDACVTSTPTWASNYGLLPNGAPTNPSDYASFVQAVAQRYGSSNGNATGSISSIEVWNEPNGYNGWSPTPDVQGYTNLLKAAYTAIKSVAPGITVVGGVLGAGISIGSLSINPVNFLQQMYADGAQGYFDALSFHPYNATSPFSAGTTFANSAIQQLQALRALMNANGDAAKLIWATEYGESSATSGGQAQQAQYIQDFLTTWSSLTGVGPMFLYSLIDDNEGNNMGLFTTNWTAKAAVAVVTAWLAAHPTTAPAASVVGSILTAISSAVQALFTGIGNLVSGAVHAVQQVVSGIATALSNLFKSVTSGVTAAAATAQHVAAAVATTAAAAVAPKATAAASAAAEGASSTAVPSADVKTSVAEKVSNSSTATTEANAASDSKDASEVKTTSDSKATPVAAAASVSPSSSTAASTTSGSASATAASTTTAATEKTSSGSGSSTPSGPSGTSSSGSGSSGSGSSTSGSASDSSNSTGSPSSSAKSTNKGKKDKKDTKAATPAGSDDTATQKPTRPSRTTSNNNSSSHGGHHTH
ncbi:MAG: cellulase family glycosylhydrolase [Mycobacterium sp.]